MARKTPSPPRRPAARQRTQPLFEQLGLAGFEEARPGQLSGGMRQRVSFLRTLMAEKDVLLLDEPFGALDSITRAQLQEWLRQAMDSVPRTVLLVTHDVDEALLLCQQVVVLSARPGRVVQVLAVGDGFRGSRREIVTSPEFASLKEQALAAIAAGGDRAARQRIGAASPFGRGRCWDASRPITRELGPTGLRGWLAVLTAPPTV